MSTIDQTLLDALFEMSECDSLDFKGEQYPLANADREGKAELIKDILAMANAWKSGDAYILVGVEEKTGARAVAKGVSHHLDDADIQQLVREKTNLPLRFNYSACQADGKEVGVIRIPQGHDRPVYLLKEYGRLNKNVVYVRRGTATVEAAPDEIARMGAARAQEASIPVIALEFADPDRRNGLGAEIILTSTLLVDPPPPPNPGISQAEWSRFLDVSAVATSSPKAGWMNAAQRAEPTPQEKRQRRQEICLLNGVGFRLKNQSGIVALDVRVDICAPKTYSLVMVHEKDHPARDSEPFLERLPGFSRVSLDDHESAWFVSIDAGKMQPQEEVWIPSHLYVGASMQTEVEMSARIFADNIPRPQEQVLTIRIGTQQRVYREKEWDQKR